MTSQFSSRMVRKVSVVAIGFAVALGIGMSSGVVHAQPVQNGYDGDPCYINGMGPFPDGTIRFFNGVTQVCKGGEWVIYNPYVSQTPPTSGGHKLLGSGQLQENVMSKD